MPFADVQGRPIVAVICAPVTLAVTQYGWLLFLHVTSAGLFFAGAVVAGVAQVAALQRDRPSEIATLLRLARYGVVFVGVGSLGALGFGLWLAGYVEGYSFGDTWIAASIALWVVSQALGGAGGRSARHARPSKAGPQRRRRTAAARCCASPTRSRPTPGGSSTPNAAVPASPRC